MNNLFEIWSILSLHVTVWQLLIALAGLAVALFLLSFITISFNFTRNLLGFTFMAFLAANWGLVYYFFACKNLMEWPEFLALFRKILATYSAPASVMIAGIFSVSNSEAKTFPLFLPFLSVIVWNLVVSSLFICNYFALPGHYISCKQILGFFSDIVPFLSSFVSGVLAYYYIKN